MNTSNDMSAENPKPLVADHLDEQLRRRAPYVRQEGDAWVFDVSAEELGAHAADHVLGCIDEGVDCGHSLAGSGILLGLDEAVAQILPRVLSGEINEITSHAGCGAAALACQQNGIETDNPDAYGMQFAKDLAARLSAESGMVVTYRHIPADEMKRPHTHDATTIYLAGGPFQPRSVPGLPQGFVVSPGMHPNAEYTTAELTVAEGIARGDHGHGPDAFTRQHPLLIVPVGSKTGLGHDELFQLAKQVFPDDKGPIVVARGISDIDAHTVSA